MGQNFCGEARLQLNSYFKWMIVEKMNLARIRILYDSVQLGCTVNDIAQKFRSRNFRLRFSRSSAILLRVQF